MIKGVEFIQDTIDFPLVAEKTVTNDTVKITVSVNALITGQAEDELRAEIHSRLKQLIDEDWHLSNITREKDPSGFERLCIIASLRVNETENNNLETRVEAASRQGLTIAIEDIDTNIPNKIIDEAQAELRKMILKKAIEECGVMSGISGLKYRVHSLKFGAFQNHSVNNNFSNVAYAQATIAAAPSGGGGVPSLGTSAKLALQANVTLAVMVVP